MLRTVISSIKEFSVYTIITKLFPCRNPEQFGVICEFQRLELETEMSEVEEERVTSKEETSEGNWFANSVVEEEPPPPGEGEVEGDSGPVAELEGKTADGERKDVKEEKCAVEGEKRGAEGEEERKLFVLGLMESDHLALRAVCEAHGAVQVLHLHLHLYLHLNLHLHLHLHLHQEVKVLPLTGGKDLTYGFVTFEQREEAAAALEHLRAHGLGGRRLTDVQFSKKVTCLLI